jgi:hypothetical protein
MSASAISLPPLCMLAAAAEYCMISLQLHIVQLTMPSIDKWLLPTIARCVACLIPAARLQCLQVCCVRHGVCQGPRRR